MAKKKGPAPAPSPTAGDQPATLKDLLNPDVIQKLKATGDDLKAAEEKRREDLRKQAEHARKAEQKRLENDFGHLLEQSGMDWRKYK
ncbi:YqkE family protein [Paenibacillus oceani]|uniref:YqkE family protein n=1 Tax=Paenibacillus oceani TaxID=2772510 RepID=A0A927CGW8_9BACL|nr:YqkE family protein [Paenibacillus oceani]MBD2866423.1 YqkE family protein [Paenibacillus oceani]